MTTRTNRMVGLSALCVCLVLVGCTQRADETRDGGVAPANETGAGSAATASDPVIAFHSEPDPLKTGDNALEVSVKQPDGAPIADATVTVVFSMPAMPSMNMPAMRTAATLTPAGDGRYRGTVPLSMAGTWNIAVEVSRGSDRLGERKFSVVAK